MYFTLVVMCLVALSASAQYAPEKGDVAVGVNLGANVGNVVNLFGYGAKVQYNVTNNIRLEPSYTYYNKEGLDLSITSYSEGGMNTSNVSIDFNSWECGINAHYLIQATEEAIEKTPWLKRLVTYPLAGVGLMNIKCSAAETKNKANNASVSKNFFGVNLGVGADLKLSTRFSLNLQAKYMLVNVNIKEYNSKLGSRSMVHFGATYRL